MAHCAAVAWLLAGFAPGCAEHNPAPRLTSVEPEQVSPRVATTVLAHGEHLYDRARVDIDSTRRPSVDRGWKIALGESDATIEDVERLDSQTLRFVVPPGVAQGVYDVVATAPDGAIARLPAGLAVSLDPVRLSLSIETAADGGGEIVGDRVLARGESLELYALFRDATGQLVSSDSELTWQLEGVGNLSSDVGASTRFVSGSAGDAYVTAAAKGGATAETGRLRVSPDDRPLQPGAALSIEDAPGGSGRAIPAQQLTTDASLLLYAVLRDELGQFLYDTEASWSVNGGIADAASAAVSSLSLPLLRPGTGSVSARLDPLSAETGLLEVAAGRARKLILNPSTADLIAGAAGLQFKVEGRDADDNATRDTGNLGWQIADGSISRIDAQSGLFSPERVGSGHIRVDSSYDLHALSGLVRVRAGRALGLLIEGLSDPTVSAGSAPLALSVTGVDVWGNPTDDVGVLAWSVRGPGFGDLDPESGVLTPRAAGSGTIRVRSSYGAAGESPTVTIVAGPISALTIQPNTAALSADDPPLTFSASGSDAFGNISADLGTLSYAVASGTLSGVSSQGTLEPVLVGSGTVRVTSSRGLAATSGTVSVVAGQLAALALSPTSLSAMVGDPATSFSAAGRDSDGNPTSDLGALSYAIASGPISTLDANSGQFTPLSAGDGTLRVTSSYGPSTLSGAIHVDAFSSRVQITAVRGPDLLIESQSGARFEIDVRNDGTRAVLTSGLYFGVSDLSNGSDLSDEYTFVADYRNTDHLAVGTTTTLIYYATVGDTITTANIAIAAALDVFHPLGLRDTPSKTFSSQVSGNPVGPSPAMSTPVIPNNRLCAGTSATFAANIGFVLSPTYAWLFPGGIPATSTLTAPTVQYVQTGNFPYSLEVTDVFGRHGNALSLQPVFVGQPVATASQTYPTGSLVFSSPTSGQSVDMTTLPRSDLIVASSTRPLVQCNGNPVDPSGARYVTLFLDRGSLDASADDHPELPGIQVELDQGNGYFSNVALLNAEPRIEGAATLYGEYFHPGLQRVTAAGTATFQLSKDTQAPQVIASWPAADCGAGCYGRGLPWIFRFSEPMSFASLSNVKIERLNGAACNSSVNSNLTGSSTISYNDAARTLYVFPPATGPASYTVRVTLGASLTDTAATPNALVPLVRCAGVSSLLPAPAAAQPVTASPSASLFSPDGDGVAESVSWNVAVDAATRIIHLQILRGDTVVWARTEIISAAGTYPLSWDGRDSSGARVFDDVYRYDVFAGNGAAVFTAPVSGAIEVDGAVHHIGVPRRY